MGFWTAVKYALNRTIGTANFSPLDEIVRNSASEVNTNVIRLRGGYKRLLVTVHLLCRQA